MAKVLIKEGTSFEQAAAELANIGITLDRHKLGDGTHRAYVRQKNKALFDAFIASFTHQSVKMKSRKMLPAAQKNGKRH